MISGKKDQRRLVWMDRPVCLHKKVVVHFHCLPLLHKLESLFSTPRERDMPLHKYESKTGHF